MSTPNPSNKTNGQAKGSNEPIFNVNVIYVKDLSFESPNVPAIFNSEWQPKVDFDLQMGSNIIDEKEGLHEVVVHLTVTVKLKEESTGFLIDVKQAGIFVVKGFDSDTTKHILSTACPTVLFPFARETVSNLVQRGGFPQLVLPPINFDAMYAQHLAEQGAKQSQSADEKVV
jgi:preprotein translocase subunit SecB